MEAMACGLPVIASSNAGVPLPLARWRVPAMNSEKIAERILAYADDRELLEQDRMTSVEFVKGFTPKHIVHPLESSFERFSEF